MTDEADLVAVHHATSPAEAEVVRTVLAASGLRAIIYDGNTPLPGVDLTPFDDDTGMVGCEVMVSVADEKRAIEALRAARKAGELTPDDVDDDDESA